jgi:hypothetical protein
MKLDGGRGALYSSLKTIQARWDATEPDWRDAMRAQFVAQVWEPLQQNVTVTLEAIDQLQAILHQMRQECEGNDFNLYQ